MERRSDLVAHSGGAQKLGNGIQDVGRRVIVFGLGKLAELVHFYLTNDTEMEVVGFTVDEEYLHTKTLYGLPVVSSSKVSEDFPSVEFAMFVAIGYSKMNQHRSAKCEWARDLGYQLVSYVSSRATTFGDLTHGDNCLILEDNTIQPFARLGNNVFLWSGNHIGHHSVVEDNVFVSSHCVVSGNCRIGHHSFLGVNSSVQNNVEVGARCFVGPQSLVRHDLAPESVLIASSTPAQKISSRNLRM